MDHELIATIEYQNDGFQKPAACIETESQLPRWTILIQILDPNCPGRRLNRVVTENPVSQRRSVNIHAAEM